MALVESAGHDDGEERMREDGQTGHAAGPGIHRRSYGDGRDVVAT
jgi:hypothetical protein